MCRKVVIYVVGTSQENVEKRLDKLIKYSGWALFWRYYVTWHKKDMSWFKAFMRYIDRCPDPVDLVFRTINDLPRGISLQKLKAYAKGGDVHFVKEKLIF